MFESQDKEWRRLTDLYAQKYDGELLELAAGYNDLTGTAQQVLRDEMNKRGLGDPTAPRAAREREVKPAPPAPANTRTEPAPTRIEPAPADIDEEERERMAQHYATLTDDDLLMLDAEYGDLTPSAQRALADELRKRDLDQGEEFVEGSIVDDPDALARAERELAQQEQREEAAEDSEEPHEYTWKVLLCECSDRTEAWQVRQFLKREGIDSWADREMGYSVQSPQVFVAADQLDEAKRVIAQPIPADIVEESRLEVPEFQMPKCPKCGAADPVLVDSTTSNTWECAACGHQWADPIEVQQ